MHDDDQDMKGGALSRDVQQHLGRRLRTELHVEADKPAFLGESSVPPQFETLVRKLEAGEQGERQGYEAVKRAIIGAAPAGTPASVEPARPAAATPLRPRIPKRPVEGGGPLEN